MIFADFSVNSQPIVLKFYKNYFRVMRRLTYKYHGKIVYSNFWNNFFWIVINIGWKLTEK